MIKALGPPPPPQNLEARIRIPLDVTEFKRIWIPTTPHALMGRGGGVYCIPHGAADVTHKVTKGALVKSEFVYYYIKILSNIIFVCISVCIYNR